MAAVESPAPASAILAESSASASPVSPAPGNVAAAGEAAGMSTEEVMRVSELAVKQLKEAAYVKGEPEWEFDHESSTGIKVYTRVNADTGIRMVVGLAQVNAAPARVMAEVENVENWKNWDPLLEAVDFKVVDDKFTVFHLKFYGIWPISGRDVCYLQTKATSAEDDAQFLAAYMCDSKLFPETESHVRASLRGGGWYIRPVQENPNVSEVAYFMNTDPKLAYLPAWIMNLAVTRFPGVIDKVRAGIAEKP